MDGFRIARNVQSLSNEREALSIDLGDKTAVISELLEENRKLKEQLAALGVHGPEDLAKKGLVLSEQRSKEERASALTRARKQEIRSKGSGVLGACVCVCAVSAKHMVRGLRWLKRRAHQL